MIEVAIAIQKSWKGLSFGEISSELRLSNRSQVFILILWE